MQHTDPRELLGAIVRILKKLRIPYLVTGGVAVFIWGRPRFTADVDIIVELHESKTEKLEEALLALGNAGYVDIHTMREAIRKHGEFNFIDGQTGIKIDFWVLQQDDFFDKERLRRKVTRVILGERVAISSPEDLILSKLRWYGITASLKQAEDILSVFAISGEKLDMHYIRKMAKKMGVHEILGRIMKDRS